jgi:hypothetical protein
MVEDGENCGTVRGVDAMHRRSEIVRASMLKVLTVIWEGVLFTDTSRMSKNLRPGRTLVESQSCVSINLEGKQWLTVGLDDIRHTIAQY